MTTEVATTPSTLLAAIVESSDDAIISTTLDGLVTFWSPAAERMFGYAATEMIGRPVVTIIPPPLVDKERALISRLGENGRMDPEQIDPRAQGRSATQSCCDILSRARWCGNGR